MWFRKHSALLVFFAVLSLTGLGLVMLYSAAAYSTGGDAAEKAQALLKTQVMWLVLGMVACGLAASQDYRIWGKYIWWILGIVCVMLVLCYVPGIGKCVKGAKRWIGAGGFTLQPSEFAKIAMLLFFAFWYSRFESKRTTFVWGFLLPGIIISPMLGLILFERDVGTTLLMGAVAFLLWMILGVRWYYLALAGMLAMAGIGVKIANDTELRNRIFSYMESKSSKSQDGDDSTQKKNRDNANGDAYQQYQSLIALGSGGVEGLGAGESRQKNKFLPEAHTDFIFAIIGEELGLRFTLAVVLAYALIIVAGGSIALRASDTYGAVLASGIVFIIAIQAFGNMGVVTQLLPNKGIALPFISKGGSSLLSSMTMIGLLVSIARHSLVPVAPVRSLNSGMELGASLGRNSAAAIYRGA